MTLVPTSPTEAVLARLRAEAPRAMFPLSNLARHGTAFHARSMAFWCDAPDDPRAILCLSGEGMLMPLLLPGAGYPPLDTLLAGRTLMGAVGEAGAVRAALKAAGLNDVPTSKDVVEPHFELTLVDLTVPPGPGMLVPASHAPGTAIEWRVAYKRELRSPPTDRATLAPQVEAAIADDTLRLLTGPDGRPLAMTGLNAEADDIVQVGGVYVPPELRRRGLGRRVVALHLAELRARGLRRATLFAANAPAARAYAGLGFRRLGDFAAVLFDPKVTL